MQNSFAKKRNQDRFILEIRYLSSRRSADTRLFDAISNGFEEFILDECIDLVNVYEPISVIS